ncbi:hypothetical protein L1887_39003 [Cichorium endivia]|nr:hypothetical protein L1887_39003 [Cichorium endivia]
MLLLNLPFEKEAFGKNCIRNRGNVDFSKENLIKNKILEFQFEIEKFVCSSTRFRIKEAQSDPLNPFNQETAIKDRYVLRV